MSDPTKVRTTTMDWATQVNIVKAAQQMDAARAGVVDIDPTRTVAYRWSSGATFYHPKQPYRVDD